MGATFGDIAVGISVDKRSFESGLTGAGADAKRFSSNLSKELRSASRDVEALAAAYVSGGKVTKQELDAAIAKEKQLQQRIEARKALLESLRGTGADLPEAGPSVVSTRSRRSEDEQLSIVKQRIQEVAAENARAGTEGSTHLTRLVKLEQELSNAIATRTRLITHAREAIVSEAAAQEILNGKRRAAIHVEHDTLVGLRHDADAVMSGLTLRRGGAQGTRGPIQGLPQFSQALAFGLQDAISAGQYGGFRGAAGAISNNLPMLGMSLSQVASQFASTTTRAGRFAAAIAPLAGPAGLIASVALPLGAILIPKLLETKEATSSLTKYFEDLKKAWSDIDVLEYRIGQRRRDPGGFMTVDQAKDAKGQAEFDLETARQRVELEEKKLGAALGGFGRFQTQLLDKIYGSDPSVGGSSFLDLEGQIKKGPQSFLTDQAANLDEGTRSAILEAERNLQKARLELETARGESTASAGKLEAAKKRDEFAKTILNPGVSALGAAATEFWQGMQKAAENSKEAKKLRDTLVKETAPKSELISATLEQRKKEIDKLFPNGGEERDSLLGLARKSALQDATEARNALLKGTTELPGAVTRGNAADFLNQMRSSLQGQDPQTKLQQENNQQNAEMLKRLERLIEALKEQPESVPTGIGF